MTLERFFAAHPRPALAFSGGTDSAFLLWAARQSGCDVRAYYARTPFQPDFEYRDALRLARALDVPLTVVEVDILALPEVASNGPERCYHCKRALFARLLEAARADGCDVLMDGTNASDEESDRPGMRALRELGVCSPLRACGLTKGEVRRRSRSAGLFTWDKPAYACLATRVPTGTALEEGLLRRAEGAESALAALGFSDFRARLAGEDLRLEVTPGQLPLALARREALLSALRPYANRVLLDLAGRQPSREGGDDGDQRRDA